jgi:hypothetical protein
VNKVSWQYVVLSAVAAVATLIVVFATTGSEPGTGGGAAARPAQPASPGWRWESYDGVVVQVPDDWGYGRTDVSPCLADKVSQPKDGYVGHVGRPGPVPAIACSASYAPAPDEQSPYLWFDSQTRAGVQAHDGGWVAETRVVGGLALTVFTDDAAVRERILDSARPAANGVGDGCPAEHAITGKPGARPDPRPGGLAAMGPIESISLCRYAIGDDRKLLSSSQLSDEHARAVLRAIRAAPAGDGPDEPGNCAPEAAHGTEALLLLVRDDTRTQQVFVRYSGCTGHGIDDGHTQRRLTSAALIPLLSGPHRPDVLDGAVAELLE